MKKLVQTKRIGQFSDAVYVAGYHVGDLLVRLVGPTAFITAYKPGEMAGEDFTSKQAAIGYLVESYDIEED